MKTILNLIGILGFSQVFAQNHYVVEYDRINDKVNYYQVFTHKGKRTDEVPVKNISVTEGDIIQGRMINVNELIFELNLNIEEVEKSVSPLKGIAALFKNVSYGSKGILGAIGSIIDVSEADDDYGGLLRGADDDRSLEFKLKNMISTINEDIIPAEIYFKTITTSLPDALTAVDMTKEEIQAEVENLESKIEGIDIKNVYNKVDQEITELKSLAASSEFADTTIVNSATAIIDKWESIEMSYFLLDDNSQIFDDARALLESVDFAYTDYYIVGDLDNDKKDLVMDFKFSLKAEDGEGDNFSDPIIYNHKMLKINRKKSALVVVNGLVVNFPMTNGTLFDIFHVGDSVAFVSKKGKMDFNLSTMLQYEFSKVGPVSPSLNLGISLPIRNFSGVSLNEGMRLLTGAGLRFNKFPNITFTTSIAWGVNEILNDNLSYNTFYDEDFLYNEGILTFDYSNGGVDIDPQYIQSKWSTGISIGVSILLD